MSDVLTQNWGDGLLDGCRGFNSIGSPTYGFTSGAISLEDNFFVEKEKVLTKMTLYTYSMEREYKIFLLSITNNEILYVSEPITNKPIEGEEGVYLTTKPNIIVKPTDGYVGVGFMVKDALTCAAFMNNNSPEDDKVVVYTTVLPTWEELKAGSIITTFQRPLNGGPDSYMGAKLEFESLDENGDGNNCECNVDNNCSNNGCENGQCRCFNAIFNIEKVKIGKIINKCCCGCAQSNKVKSDSTPVGAIWYFAMPEAPKGWLECNGKDVSRKDYEKLFEEIGTIFGEGDGIDTFNLPDLRGEFIRGYDSERGIDQEREFGSAQKASLGIIDPTKGAIVNLGLYHAENDNHQEAFQKVGFDALEDYTQYPGIQLAHQIVETSIPLDYAGKPCAGAVRPRNIALLPCIKY